MRILIAFDKFKDSLTALEACATAARALGAGHPGWELDLCPLADGGDGFAEILTRSVGGRREAFRVTGPRGAVVEAPVGFVEVSRIPPGARAFLGLDDAASDGSAVAVVEMASASGLALLAPELRDPWRTTSAGTGQLIRAAAEAGAAMVLLGVGGSATHDLGLGALAALGYGFEDEGGGAISSPVPADWPRLARIRGRALPSLPPIRIACDVTNPLLGPNGAAAVFGPQKGLKAADVGRLDAESSRLASLLCDHCLQTSGLAGAPGAGAAGGIAFGLMVAAGAELLQGFPLVAAWLDVDARIAAADIVITGEGRFDESSLGGKGPGAIAARARSLGKPAHVFAGEVRGGAAAFLHGITPAGVPLAQALRETRANLAAAVADAFR
jgi:glycerate kinase